VRELENVIERIVVMARSNEITLDDLQEPFRRQQPALDFLPLELPHSGINIEAIEKELILRALKKFDWNQTHAARFLDLSRKTLIYRMEKFGLRRKPRAGDQPGGAPQR
jgi:two-component system response regulator AtoC